MQKKVLIVDDEAPCRALYQRVLRDRYDLCTASNGQEALEKLASEKPDGVLLNVEMPVMNGIELIAYMKEKEKLKNIPVIVISSYKIYSKKVGAMGVNYFIDKSEFSEEILINTIKKENLL